MPLSCLPGAQILVHGGRLQVSSLEGQAESLLQVFDGEVSGAEALAQPDGQEPDEVVTDTELPWIRRWEFLRLLQ